MTFSPQVEATHYVNRRYLNKERWQNYWYQIEAVLASGATHILEVGVGNGIVANALRTFGVTVDTVDIDPALSPTHVASVTQLPFSDGAYEFVLCAEVLEHLPYEQSLVAMKELRRVSSKSVLVTLPHAGYVFSHIAKLPFLPWISWGSKIPHFWKTHVFNGQHYWELGKKGYSKKKLQIALGSAGFRFVTVRTHPDDPAHVFYCCDV